MAISSIQPITNFSMILPATPVSPREMLSVASDLVTTPSASAVVTLGTAQPLSPPLFNSAGLIDFANGGGLSGFPTNGVSLGAPGSVGQTPQSQALADDLSSALNDSSSTGFASALAAATQNIATNTSTTTGGTTNGAAATSGSSASMSALNNLINANLDLAITGLNSIDTTTSALNGTLAADVQLALVGIGAGAGTTAAVGTPSPTTTPSANGLVAAPTVTATPATAGTTTAGTTTTGATATGTTATGTTAAGTTTTGPATTPPATTTPAPLPAAPATVTPPTPASSTTTAGAVTPTATPAVGTTTATTPPGTAAGTFGTALPGTSPAAVLQSLVADVNARAAANLIDPGFAATSAALFVSAAVFRASGNGAAATTAIGTADTAGAPPPEVTAVRPAQAV
jgi:hypothetical protein